MDSPRKVLLILDRTHVRLMFDILLVGEKNKNHGPVNGSGRPAVRHERFIEADVGISGLGGGKYKSSRPCRLTMKKKSGG